MEIKDSPTYVTWEGPFAIDGDGAPNCYGPPDKPGLDYLANAGHPATKDKPAEWYGILVDSHGQPIVQGPDDPCPGMYISPTALVDHGYGAHDPRRYVDSTATSYISIPSNEVHDHILATGDVGLAFNRVTSQWAAAIVADVGPKNKFGEGSIALAKAIGIKNTSPKNGGADSDIVWIVFKNSSLGWPRSPAEVNDQVEILLTAAGGIEAFI